MARILLVGASNVRRSLPTIVRLARAEFGPGLEVWGAFGHGRSYGKRSCIPFRCLPGIRESGLWDALERGGGKSELAVAADAGNDILYGEEPATILRWVEACLDRVDARRRVIVGLPLAAVRNLGGSAFLAFRTAFFPSSRVTREAVVRLAEELDAGLREVARARGARFVEPEADWYHVDPIHIRRRCRAAAWAEILGVPETARPMSVSDAIRLRLASPERRWIAGFETRRAQPALRIAGKISVSLY